MKPFWILTIVVLATSAALFGGSVPKSTQQPRSVAGRQVELRDGKMFIDGQWVFLKVGKPLINFGSADAVQKLIDDLDVLKQKNYNVLELNCYWHHIDPSGDGKPDVDLGPLRRLIDEINGKGMFACLSVETYGVGGGQIPEPFLKRYPDALAVDSEGKGGIDTEYGFLSAIPSIYHPEYRKTAHHYIEQLASALGPSKLLWFETTVEPQYMGEKALDYSKHARAAFDEWQRKMKVDGPEWPKSFPVPQEFIENETWNRFRAEALAEWVNEDAAAYRRVAGPHAYVAVDYLETDGPEMPNRNGDSLVFLRHLTSSDIIQVNWHWVNSRNKPNTRAYDNVRKVMKETGRPWAITEHMTLNGTDYQPHQANDLLENTLMSGTRLGWEFVNVSPDSKNPFALYQDDWTPKPLMEQVDNHWPRWMKRVRDIEALANPPTH